MKTVQKIHEFNYPLGGGQWLNAQYIKVGHGYHWEFVPYDRRVEGDDARADVPWTEVISRALAYLPRFGRLTDPYKPPYTVGRHSVLLERWLKLQGYAPASRIVALLHDAPECLGAGDMNTHLKDLVGGTTRVYEADLLQFLLREIGVEPTPFDMQVAHASDKMFGASEARILDMWNGEPWKAEPDTEVYKFLEAEGLYDASAGETRQSWRRAYSVAMLDYSNEK